MSYSNRYNIWICYIAEVLETMIPYAYLNPLRSVGKWNKNKIVMNVNVTSWTKLNKSFIWSITKYIFFRSKLFTKFQNNFICLYYNTAYIVRLCNIDKYWITYDCCTNIETVYYNVMIENLFTHSTQQWICQFTDKLSTIYSFSHAGLSKCARFV